MRAYWLNYPQLVQVIGYVQAYKQKTMFYG